MKYLGFLLVLLISLSSCNQKIKEARLAQIDSLGTHLNHVHEVVNSVDTNLIVNRMSEITRNGDWLLENITDTLAAKPGIELGDYLRSKKFYGKAFSKYGEVKAELIYSEKQLTALRNDVKNKFYSDEEFGGYFRTEAESIKALVAATDNLENSYGSLNEQYQFSKPRITGILDSIKNIVYSSEPITKK
jgi:hypothetical protein